MSRGICVAKTLKKAQVEYEFRTCDVRLQHLCDLNTCKWMVAVNSSEMKLSI